MATYHLRLLGAKPARRVRVEAGRTMTLGRDPACDLVLPDVLGISKRHAEIEQKKTDLLVRGLGVGGVAVNGRHLKAQSTLRAGDKLQLGTAFVLVELEKEADAARPPEPPPVPAAERSRIPGFELSGEIASAGAWKLYRARDKARGEDVALKVLDADQAKDLHVVERFTREGEALRRLDHPSIVRILSTGRHGDLHYHVTELVPGGVPLSLRLRLSPLGVLPALQVGIQVAHGLALAHLEGIVHRDVAPPSILVTPGGVAKISNFACVRVASERGQTITSLGEVVGTMAYCSPEQAADPRKADARSDVYALGATLYHAIAGAPPFPGKTAIELIRQLMTTSPRPLAEVAEGVPDEVSSVVMRCLARRPEERWKDAPALVAALQAALLEASSARGEDAAAKPASAGISGAYSGTELLEIMTLLEMHRKSGALAISAPPEDGEVALREGRIVAARAGALEGASALDALLATEAGVFRFDPREGISGPLDVKPTVAAVRALRLREAGS